MSVTLKNQDQTDLLLEQVQTALAQKYPLAICGGGSKSFLGHSVQAQTLHVGQHQGIVDYDPSELVVTVRSGTTITELSQALHEHGQYLPFEPAHFSGKATVGGVVASGLSGPRRPWVGSVRDYVLGCRVITGDAKHLRFGGQVMKNVAGYDVSRLMAGSMGTLGVITEVSFKLLPVPRRVAARRLSCTPEQSRLLLQKWQALSYPLSGALYTEEALHVRLEGGHSSVTQALEAIGGEVEQDGFWEQLRELSLPFFKDARPLWRVAQAVNAGQASWPGEALNDWGGSLVWLKSDASRQEIHALAEQQGGHATLYGNATESGHYAQLAAPLMKFHQQLKDRLDPARIFNPGRMYPGL